MPKNVLFGEIAATSVVIGALNVLIPATPGFRELYFLPYLVVALFFASYAGYFAGIASMIVSAVTVAGLMPLALYLIPTLELPGEYWDRLGQAAMLPAAVALVLVYLFGQMRVVRQRRLQDARQRLEELTRQHWNQKRKADALERVNRELEERVARQRESLTSLHTQLDKLNTLDVGQCLRVLLETIHIFTGATRSCVYRYEPDRQRLERASEWVPEGSAPVVPEIALDGTIEGWVFRNDSMFSVRMLVSLDNLRQMDSGRSILTVPIHVRRRVWGILNIEDMPFEKYNLYAERIITIVLGLAQPALERALEHQRLLETQEVDEDTGLPYVSIFYRQLENALSDAGASQSTMTIVLLEVMNYDRIVSEQGPEQAKELWVRLSEELKKLSEHRAEIYHYKEENQIAALFSGLDYDGASLFCLETLELMNSADWTIGEEKTPLEVAIGYASYAGKESSIDQLIDQAETLLDMQKS